MDMHPYTIAVPQAVLDDLAARLARTRWPDDVEGAGWDYGVNLAYLQELVDYWRTDFDWRKQERALNTWQQYQAEIDGLRIHFLYERGKGPNPLPLLLTHGWPSAFTEMLKVIPLLTDPASHGGDPADAFDVVVPSLPGYGFSDHVTWRGPWNTHGRWAALMRGLGYERFGAQGGDVGAGVTTALGRFFPEQVSGIHLSSDLASPSPLPPSVELSAEEQEYLARVARWEQEEGAYSHQQQTRPQTLAYGLTDSPVGLAAWIAEKFRAWSDCGGDVERRFSKDELLTTITLYWVTQTIGSSIRGYYQGGQNVGPSQRHTRVEVPTGVAVFPGEYLIGRVPRAWAERTYNIRHWTEMPRGGHFAALEEPELLVDDIRTFFRALRGVSPADQ
jgi:pimeloyl-ACP methyl ester carboxylesterase